MVGKGAHAGLRVLVIDDVETVRAVTVRMLERMGCVPTSVARGGDAIALLKQDPAAFDLLLLDLSMPEMSGEETLDAALEIAPDVSVILMTGYADVATTDAFWKRRANVGFIEKPFRPDDLLRQIEEVSSSG